MENKQLTNEKTLLSICIPTYNRAEILNESLEDLLPKIKDLPIKIIVIDNDSIDNTQEIVKKYPVVKYYKNKTNIGGDMNILESYKIASNISEYICVLGDSYRFQGDIHKFIELLKEKKYDLVVISRWKPGYLNITTNSYTDPNRVLFELGGFMDLTGSIVIRKDAIVDKNYKDFLWSNFIHFAIAFNYIVSIRSPQCLFYDDLYLYHTSKNKVSTSWYGKSIVTFSKVWVLTILSLSEYDIESRLSAIKKHDYFSPIFTVRRLIYLRAMKFMTLCQVRENKMFLPFVTTTPYWIFIIISSIPPIFSRILNYIYDKMSKFWFTITTGSIKSR